MAEAKTTKKELKRSSEETLIGDHPIEEPAASPAPNIRFVGRTTLDDFDKGQRTIPAIPPERIIDGDATFLMPPAEVQTKGFYHPDAGRLIRAFPSLYKRFSTNKGK